MLSRASILSGQSRTLATLGSRVSSSTPNSSAQAAEIIETQRRNLANSQAADQPEFRRPVRQEPGKVRMGFIPEEWFTFFYKKTGVTGPYTFGVALSTYLISKEIYVMEHEYYSGLSLAILCYLGVTKLGPGLAKALDKDIDDYEAGWNEGRNQEKAILQSQIKEEEKNQWSAEGQMMLMQAKRENVALQLEAAYRQRLQTVYTEVKRRLDYQVEKQNAELRIAQKNLVDYVVRRVTSSITPDQAKQNIDRCITDLAALSK